MMNDQAKAAFASATETVKNVLTLSSAILTISITFAKDINKHPTPCQVHVLETSWVFLLIGIIFCIHTLMAITGALATNDEPTGKLLYKANIGIPMGIAIISFLLGVIFTATFGMLSV